MANNPGAREAGGQHEYASYMMDLSEADIIRLKQLAERNVSRVVEEEGMVKLVCPDILIYQKILNEFKQGKP